MMSAHTLIFIFIALSLIAVPVAADGCHHGNHNSSANCDFYDHAGHHSNWNGHHCDWHVNGRATALQSLEGKITEIEYLPGPAPDMAMVEVYVESGSQSQLVRLGPVRFLKNSGLILKEGDSVAVRGFPITGMDTNFISAVDIRKGEKILSLRDSWGQPAW